MGVTVDVSFPLRRYHATPWDAGANSGFVEWPPSPWRILRAFLAVAHARTYNVDEAIDLLAVLGNPEAFSSVSGTVGSTRHYMPDVKHRSDGRGNTDLVVDAYLSFPLRSNGPDLRIHWGANLGDRELKLLELLSENLPYLGRSESICDATVSEKAAAPDGSWWRLGESGDDVESVNLLSADGRVTAQSLEADPTSVRSKLRKVYPPGTRMLSYGRHFDARSRLSIACESTRRVTHEEQLAVRLQLRSPAPIPIRNFLLATDRCHAAVRQKLDTLVDSETAASIVGRAGDGPRQSDHNHLHVVALPDDLRSSPFAGGSAIDSLLFWSPEGLSEETVDAICRIPKLYTSQKISESSFATQTLLVAGVGDVSKVADGLVRGESGTRRWRSATPYFPVRHRKRESIDEWIRADLEKEFGYRAGTADLLIDTIRVDDSHEAAAELVRFRRRRIRENRERTRKGYFVDLTLTADFKGPLLLGQLSHFGAGLFVPSSD